MRADGKPAPTTRMKAPSTGSSQTCCPAGARKHCDLQYERGADLDQLPGAQHRAAIPGAHLGKPPAGRRAGGRRARARSAARPAVCAHPWLGGRAREGAWGNAEVPDEPGVPRMRWRSAHMTLARKPHRGPPSSCSADGCAPCPLLLQVVQLGLVLYFVVAPVDYPGGRTDPIREWC